MQTIHPERLGQYISTTFGGETVRSLLPPPLPPVPPLRLDRMQALLEQANLSLGRLDGLAAILPDLPLFLYAYVRKEAVLSSQIEGTQSSLSDLLMFEHSDAPGVPTDDVQEVSNYVAALTFGMKRLKEGFPLSLRLIREIHGVLLAEGRGSDRAPGEFRRSQNWIGGTRPGNAAYVPPPAENVIECMGALEQFLHGEGPDMPVLIRAGLAHVQFESIHPFLDGNGRLGRLLITFLLCARGALREPILYLSLYLKTHRPVYYDLLTRVRQTGDWEAWLDFFLLAVKETSEQAVASAHRILALLEKDRKRVESIGRQASSALRVFHYLQTHPVTSLAVTARETGITFPTASKCMDQLRALEIVTEMTGKKSGRLFFYKDYVGILSEGTEPLAATA